jgi:hypothetical protein
VSNRSLAVLAAVTLVTLLLAVVVSSRRAAPPADAGIPERLAPGLDERVNDVAWIVVAQGGRSVELAREGSAWLLSSKDGYPARLDVVKRLVLGVAELTPVERKTADPARFERIGLRDPGAGRASVRVTLRDGAGATLADVVLGDPAAGGGPGGSRRFARLAGEDQAWLVEGRVAPATDPMAWIEREILGIPQPRVAGVTVTRPGGETLEVRLADPETPGSYEIVGVPEGRTPQPGAAARLAGAIGYVGLTDVRPRPEPATPRADAVAITYGLTSGLSLVLTTWAEGERWWLTIDAIPSAGDGEDGFDLSTDEAEQLGAALGPWAFEIDRPKAESLRPTMEGLTDAASSSADGGATGPGD